MEYSLIFPVLKGTNSFFLQQRDKKAPVDPDLLGTFGGGIEANETPLEAAVRELREETSLQFEPEDLDLVGTDIITSSKRGLYKAYVFMLEIENADFDVFEGSGKKLLTKKEALRRKDIAPGAYKLLKLLPDKFN